MRPLLALAFTFCLSPGSTVPPEVSARVLFCSSLQAWALKTRLEHHQPLGSLKIEALGHRHQILFIHDDSDAAKTWFDDANSSRDIRNKLSSMGFTSMILVNRKHGTFVFDLTAETQTIATNDEA